MSSESTPIPVIANVSRIVTRVVDRVTGDRVDAPLLVAAATVEALKTFGIESQIMYGKAAWIEVLENQSVVWAGCWGDNYTFWVATKFGETVDLNTSVAHRKRSHWDLNLKAKYSPPILWSRELPKFYKYVPEGVAAVGLEDLKEERDQRNFKVVLAEIREKCGPAHVTPDQYLDDAELEFPNEPILCPGRRILDDSTGSFKHFDRAVAVSGIPASPI